MKKLFALLATVLLAAHLAGCLDKDPAATGERPVAEISTDNVSFSNGTYHASVNYPVIFNASKSFALEGDIRQYIWNFGDGGVGYDRTISHIFLDEGTYTVTLTVRDSDGRVDADFVKILVFGTAGYSVIMEMVTTSHVSSPGRDAVFTAVIVNLGNVEDTYAFKGGNMPSGFVFVPKFAQITLLPGEKKMNIFTYRIPSTATKVITSVSAVVESTSDRSVSDEHALTIDIKNPGAGPALAGNLVQCQYIGLYPSGEVFDSSLGQFQDGRTDAPLKVSLGTASSGGYTTVIVGFKNGLIGMRVGETNVVYLTPEEGYNDGEDRIFVIELVSIDS